MGNELINAKVIYQKTSVSIHAKVDRVELNDKFFSSYWGHFCICL